MAIALFVGLSLMLTAERASACIAEHLSVQESLERAEAVFAGRLVRFEALEWNPSLFLVEFRVTRVWKGARYETRWVGDISNDCGNFFEAGVEYLIYGANVPHPDRNGQYGDSRVLLMTLGFATSVENSVEDIDYLGPGQPPVPGWVGPRPGEEEPPMPADTGTGTSRGAPARDGWTVAVAAGAAVFLAGLGRMALRRRP
ncbi:MAG: hypothetical protein OXH41_13380 [Chloroflexi bacterium]|nr:hypothetical protein [Chloroflexota bacterium]